MKKSLIKVLAVTVIAILACGGQLQAQNLLKGLKDAAQKAVGGTVSGQSSTPNTNAPANRAPAAKGKTYYVSVSTGSARADGLSPTSAMKDLQKAIDAAEENDEIRVAEGNYLGNLDRGYIEIGRFGNSSQESDRGKFIII